MKYQVNDSADNEGGRRTDATAAISTNRAGRGTSAKNSSANLMRRIITGYVRKEKIEGREGEGLLLTRLKY